MRVGTDIIEIERVKQFYDSFGLSDKLLTEKEKIEFQNISNKKRIYELFAGKFCAKEAVAKAFGFGISNDINWKDIEVLHDSNNAPIITLYNKVKELFVGNYNEISISISHSDNYAIATCIVS